MAQSFQFDTDYYKPTELRNSEEETKETALRSITIKVPKTKDKENF